MSKGVFSTEAPKYWAKGLSALPIKKGTKQPAISSWTAYQANLPNSSRREEWLRKNRDCGIGINLGTPIFEDQLIMVLDADDDVWVPSLTNIFGEGACAKRGKKGASFFARVAKSGKVKSTALKAAEGFGGIDILVGGRQAVLPPSIHPDTELPYKWLGPALCDVNLKSLPQIDHRFIKVLTTVIKSEHVHCLVSGKETHSAALTLVAQLASSGATDEEIRAFVVGLLPKGYAGDTVKELPGMIASAREKGFDQGSIMVPYDPGDDGPIPLGFDAGGQFVVRDQSRGLIIAATASQLLSPQWQLGLAPREFWISRFSTSKGYSSMEAGNALIECCREKGPFDPTSVRGRGIWEEGDRIVPNLGELLPDDLQHQYLCFIPVPIEPCEAIEAERLHDLLKRFTFRDPGNATMLLGWLATAIIAGALDWRPHGFIYGPPNTGKTTLHNLIAAFLTPLVVAADGQSTEAGIRQRIGPDALPVLLDEFETDSEPRRLQGIMRLARSASSADSPLLRGTPEGKAMQFSIKASFMFSAVNVASMTPADQSRILMMELCPHDSDPEVGAEIERELAYFKTQGPRWCGYVMGLAKPILEAIPVISAAMPEYDSRLRKTFATLLAGMFVTLNRRVPTEDEAISLVDQYRQTIVGHQRDQERDNAQECLTHLLSHIVRAPDVGEDTIGYWLASELKRLRCGDRSNVEPSSKWITENLQARFLVGTPKEGLLIRNNSEAMDRIFAGTRWANGSWNRALGQLPGAFRLQHPQSFPKVPGKHRSIGIPLEHLPDLDDEDETDVSF